MKAVNNTNFGFCIRSIMVPSFPTSVNVNMGGEDDALGHVGLRGYVKYPMCL
jgi:hypothetical protein